MHLCSEMWLKIMSKQMMMVGRLLIQGGAFPIRSVYTLTQT